MDLSTHEQTKSRRKSPKAFPGPIVEITSRLSGLRPGHWLLVVLGVALTLRMVFFMGLCVADDFTYCGFAKMILNGDPYFTSQSEFRSLRWPTILPVVLSFWLTGVNEFSAVWGSLVYSLLGIVVVFYIGQHLFGYRTGLYAAFLLAIFPCDVIFATQLMPDIAISFFMGLSVLLFLRGDAENDPKRSMLQYGACGLAMLGAFLCRVTAVYHFLFFACIVFSGNRMKRGAWLAFVCFGLGLAMLYFFYFLKSGDVFHELTLLHKIRATEESLGRITQLRLTQNLQFMLPIVNSIVGRADIYAVQVHIWLASTYLFGFFYYLIVPCFLYLVHQAWKRRDGALAVPVLWFAITYLYSEFGPINLEKYQTMVKLPRYLSVQTFPGLLLLALTLERWIHQPVGGGGRRMKCVGLGSLAFLSWSSLVISGKEAKGLLEPMAPYRETFRLLKDKPRRDVFVLGGWWPMRMSLYLGRESGYLDPPEGPGNRLRSLRGALSVGDVRDAYVILDRAAFQGIGDFKFSYSEFPRFVEHPPPSWERIGLFQHTEVYYAPKTVPQAVIEEYSKVVLPVVDFSTWEGARSAIERSVRENNLELFKSCLSEGFRRENGDPQIRALFGILLKNPEVLSRLERKHFMQEKGQWHPVLAVQPNPGARTQVEVK